MLKAVNVTQEGAESESTSNNCRHQRPRPLREEAKNVLSDPTHPKRTPSHTGPRNKGARNRTARVNKGQIQEERSLAIDNVPETKMSLTPPAPRHQSPPRSKQQTTTATLLPLERKPTTTSSTLLTKPTSTLLTKPTCSPTPFTKPTSSSTLLTKPSTSFSRTISNRSTGSNARVPSGSLGTISSELSLNKRPAGRGCLVPISSNNRETELVQFERSKNKYDGRAVVLPQDDADISIDKLLAQWADKINKAEQEFEEEELAFQRAQARLSATPNRASLRSLSPNASTRLLEKSKRIIGSQNQNDNTRPSPIKKHHHPL